MKTGRDRRFLYLEKAVGRPTRRTPFDQAALHPCKRSLNKSAVHRLSYSRIRANAFDLRLCQGHSVYEVSPSDLIPNWKTC